MECLELSVVIILPIMVMICKGEDGLSECGKFRIEQPTVLGRNITFSFTPDVHNPNAHISWERTNGGNTWSILHNSYKFKRYQRNRTYYLILTDSIKNDEASYRVHYYYQTMHCLMEAKRLYLDEPPSIPKIVGLQDIENCADCIIGQNNEEIKIACHIDGGTRPLTVTMTIGNDSYSPQKLNSSTYIVSFYLRNYHHMQNVIFSIMNKALTSPMNVTAQMFVINPPVIMFNITGLILNVPKGERTHVKCLADSVPTSSISWIEELSNGNISKKQCGLTSNCVLTIDTDKVGTRKFMCQIQYRTKVDHRYLTVHVAEKVENDDENNDKQKIIDQDLEKSDIWIILGACLLVVGIIVITVLIIVIRKRRQNHTEKRESRVDHHNNEDGKRTRLALYIVIIHNVVICKKYSYQNAEGSVAEYQNKNAYATENEADVPVYSQPIKKKTTENLDNIYAQVNKVRKSASPQDEEKPKQREHGQLLYADLALDSSDSTSQAGVDMRRDSTTEYADIDHVMTKANKEVNETPTVMETTYANQ